MAIITLGINTFNSNASAIAIVGAIRGGSTVAIVGISSVNANQPIKITPSTSQSFSSTGSLVGNQPVIIRYSKVNAIIGSASTTIVDPMRLRYFDSPGLLNGDGNVTLISGMWKYKTVRGSLTGTAILEAYLYEYRDIKQDMSDYMPKYYSDSLEAKEIIRTEANEFIRFNALALDVLNQFYPTTATWGIERWEKLFKIDTDMSRNIVDRREEVIERIRGFYLVTLELLEQEANKICSCIVIQDPRNLTVTIKIIDNTVFDNKPLYYQKFVTKMTALVPCHLELLIEMKRTAWGELKEKNITWNEMKLHTWEGLKTNIF